jgi:hypothetical protein
MKMESLNIISEEGQPPMVTVDPQQLTITFRDNNGLARTFDLMELRELVIEWFAVLEPIR